LSKLLSINIFMELYNKTAITPILHNSFSPCFLTLISIISISKNYIRPGTFRFDSKNVTFKGLSLSSRQIF